MPYVNVTLDVGAAMNAFKLIWNYQSRLVVHLGDFHFIKENFGVTGKIVKSSGCEDVIFQANVCSSGSLNGVLSETHYNRAWTVHAAFSEALERLLFERFLQDSSIDIPNWCFAVAKDNEFDFREAIVKDTDLFTKYMEFKEMVRDGKYGITAQFWLSLYLDLMEKQHLMHAAVQENSFDLRRIRAESRPKVNYRIYCSLIILYPPGSPPKGKSARKMQRCSIFY